MTGPAWQCVLICWGTRYPVALINRLVARIRAQAAVAPRFLLITDAPKPDLDPEVALRDFPAFFLDPRFRGAGCQAKLAMFEPGLVPADLPAIYLDLDTVVTGDLGAGVGLMPDRRAIGILPSAILPFGAIGRLAHRISGGRRYARGNSSMVIWHPAECGFVAERFRALCALYPDLDFRPMIADERFISWVAQDRVFALPKSFIAKFPGEFMFPWKPWLGIRARLPGVRARRARLAAITLCGLEVKPERLLALPEGAELTDRKGRVLIWSDAAMGPARAQIIAQYRDVR